VVLNDQCTRVVKTQGNSKHNILAIKYGGLSGGNGGRNNQRSRVVFVETGYGKKLGIAVYTYELRVSDLRGRRSGKGPGGSGNVTKASRPQIVRIQQREVRGRQKRTWAGL